MIGRHVSKLVYLNITRIVIHQNKKLLLLYFKNIGTNLCLWMVWYIMWEQKFYLVVSLVCGTSGIYKMKSCFLFVMTFRASTRHLWLIFCTTSLKDIWSRNVQNGKHFAGTLDLISGLPSLQSCIKHCTESN